MNSREAKLEAFGRLLDIMDTLRAECPWDRKQTLESLRHLTIEETYELADAIEENDLNEIKKELGVILADKYAPSGSLGILRFATNAENDEFKKQLRDGSYNTSFQGGKLLYRR